MKIIILYKLFWGGMVVYWLAVLVATSDIMDVFIYFIYLSIALWQRSG